MVLRLRSIIALCATSARQLGKPVQGARQRWKMYEPPRRQVVFQMAQTVCTNVSGLSAMPLAKMEIRDCQAIFLPPPLCQSRVPLGQIESAKDSGHYLRVLKGALSAFC